MDKKNLSPVKPRTLKLFPWQRSKFVKTFKLGKDSKGGVILDKNGTPMLFLFDTFAFLDVLSKIDEALVDRLSTDEYHSMSVNPAGWLIDEIESKLPLKPAFVLSLKSAVEEANKKGWIPFSKIQADLGRA